MKKTSKRLFSLMLTAVMMLGMAISGYAAGVVTFEANEQKFDFAPGSVYSPSDLFTDFKNLMPGDSITQSVRVKNNGKDGYTTNIYIRALGATPDKVIKEATDTAGEVKFEDGKELNGTGKTVNQKLLSQLKLNVVVKKDSKKLFDATADKTDGLTDWVLLGSLRKGGEVDLDVTVTVPVELTGEDMENVAAGIDWQFKVEEIPDPAPVVPDTGDNTGVMLYGAMFGMAALALFAIIVLKKRTKEE